MSKDGNLYYRLNDQVSLRCKMMGSSSLSPVRTFHREIFDESSGILSPIGICVPVYREFPAGSVISLNLKFIPFRMSFLAFGMVSWCGLSRERNGYIAGLKIVAFKDGGPDLETHEKAKALVEIFSVECIVEDPKPDVLIIQDPQGTRFPVIVRKSGYQYANGVLPLSMLLDQSLITC